MPALVLLATATEEAALGEWDWGWQAVRAARVRRVRGVFMVAWNGFQAAYLIGAFVYQDFALTTNVVGGRDDAFGF